MRSNPTKRIEAGRVRTGPLASDESIGANGQFFIASPSGARLCLVVSDGSDWSESGLPLPVWEHVSVSTPSRCPTWDEMDFVKRLIWRDDELVLQMHVPRSQHVNFHPYCLHLWKPVGVDIPTPPGITVGPVVEAAQ